MFLIDKISQLAIVDFLTERIYNVYIIVRGKWMMENQVQEVLNKLRPFLLRDGGDVELVDVDEGIVRLRLMGACGNCPSSTITLKAGIERALMAEVPGVREIEQVF